jgi:hypothetical protein
MQIPDASLRPWNKLVGSNGDLADVLLGILSLASARHGIARIRITHFYQAAQNLNADFPFIPSSLKSLCGAMEEALQIGVVISSDFQHFVVSQNVALKNIGRLRSRMGESFLHELAPIAERFASMVKG